MFVGILKIRIYAHKLYIMKKSIKTIVASLALLLFVAVSANAQDKAADGAKAVTSHMKEQLKLNDSQYTKVYAVNLDFMQKAMDNKKADKTKVEKAKRLKALDDERDTKLKSVLSDEQFKIFIANKAENRKKLRQHFMDKGEE
jgi:hypothetical protein